MKNFNFDFEKCFKDVEKELEPDLEKRIMEAVEDHKTTGGLIGYVSGITTGHAIDVNYRVMVKYHDALSEYLSLNYQLRP